MGKVSLHGQMAESTRETTLMTRSRAMGSSLGPMAASTMASGSTESNTEKVSTTHLRPKSSAASGKKERGSGGSQMSERYI